MDLIHPSISQHDYKEQIDDMMLSFEFCVLQQKNYVKSM
jgi:hypothetical protein